MKIQIQDIMFVNGGAEIRAIVKGEDWTAYMDTTDKAEWTARNAAYFQENIKRAKRRYNSFYKALRDFVVEVAGFACNMGTKEFTKMKELQISMAGASGEITRNEIILASRKDWYK